MQTITVDMTPGFRQPTIHYSQNDVGTTFAIDLRSRFGDTLPASPTVKIQATKPSGFGFSIEADSVVDSVATFTTVATMTDEAGRFLAELEVSDSGVVLYTANFYMEGEANPHPIGTTDGSQETIIPTLTLLVERVEAAAESVLDMTVNATTLAAGSQATYSYDEDTNTATFGIPQGEAGAGAAGVTASAYSSSKTYAVGDYVIHNSNLYRCTTAITTAEAFTAAHWTQVVLADDVSDVKSDLNEVWNVQKFHLPHVTSRVFAYTFTPKKTYYFTNLSSGMTVSIRTSDSSGTLIELVKNNIAYGETVKFTATLSASYFRIYSANMDVDVEVTTNGHVLTSVDTAIEDIDAKVQSLSKISGDIAKYKNWKVYQKPQGFSEDIPINIFTDGHSYITDFNKENHKNVSANTYYVSPSGSNSNVGTRANPWATLYYAVTNASSGDTIVLLEGDYDRSNDIRTDSIKKSLNIIGEGKVRLFNGNCPTFSAVSGYTKTYKGTRTYGLEPFEIHDDEIILLTLVDNIADVEATAGSYYKSGDDYYVHPTKSGTPNNGGAKICVSVDYTEVISFDNSTQNVKAYIENLTIVGSTKSCCFERTSASYSLDVCLNRVNLLWCGGGSSDTNALQVYGGNIIINECNIFGSYRDGFNYCGTIDHGATYRDNIIVEINCEASNCGIGRTETNMNGSTAHRNSKVVRINGTYHDNHGPNCCDVQSDTESINLGCIAYNSTAEPNAANHNFDCQTEGAKMWLENCIGIGAYADFYCPSDGTMYMNKCSYDTKSGSGIVDTDAVSPMKWMLRNYNTSEQALRR